MKIELVSEIPDSAKFGLEMGEKNRKIIETVKRIRTGEIIKIDNEIEDKKRKTSRASSVYELLKKQTVKLEGTFRVATRMGVVYVQKIS